MSDQRIPENIVVCIDTSRSMYRRDFKPNRLVSCSVLSYYILSPQKKGILDLVMIVLNFPSFNKNSTFLYTDP